MAGYTYFLFVYVLGGITFIPLLLIALLIHAYLTFPVRKDVAEEPVKDVLIEPGDRADVIQKASKGLDERFKSKGPVESDVAAGYFAVCREYTPGGINGKPPERITPTGPTAVTSASPSVYQSMYRSIFERKKEPAPFDSKGPPKPPNKTGNIFYIVLRHQHLLLFDSEEQIEVRYVIPLAHHDVSLYAGGEDIPEGEVFIKRNAICLTRRSDVGELTADGQHSKPFYLFADNLSDKEDFYFALLKNMERRYDDPHSAPVPLQFDVKHIIDLVKHLHSSEENMQTRWFNALLGRIFLGVYKTTDIQNFIKAKITKKISRVKKPSFLSKIVIRSVDLGEGAPSITNPRLKDLTVDGDCTIEADMLYTGKARVEIAATARIELGSRFKAREVDLVLAVTCKRIEGHMLFRVKPPPSNRMWMTFEHPPRMDLSIEPIVSSRQITYNVILRQIESRIKEVIAETVVMPFWDDLAFFNTEGKTWRAGVFVDSAITRPAQSVEDAIAEEGDVDAVEQAEAELASPDSKQGSPFSPPIEKSMSTPALDASPPATFASKAARSVFNLGSTKPNGSSKSVDVKPAGSETPRSLRRSSNATPVVRVDGATVGAVKSTPSGQATSAASSMAAISAKSPPVRTPVGSPENVSKLPMDDASSFSSGSSKEASQSTDGSMAGKDPANFMVKDGHLEMNISKDHLHSRSQSHDLNNTPSKFKFDATNHRNSNISMMTTGSTDSGSSRSSTKKSAALNAVANAAENARKWGLNALQRTRESAKSISEPELPPDLSQPMGRGQPLPPIGTPLPKPERSTKTAPMPVPKRKPLPPPDMSQDQLDKEARAKLYAQASERHLPPPVIPKRRPVPQNNAQDDENDGIFIVPAPYSEPPSPTESRKEYMSPSVEEEVENEYAQEQMLSKPPPPPLPRRRRDSDGAASDSEEVKGDLATENILVVRA